MDTTFIWERSYVAPVCFVCAQHHELDDVPDVVAGMDEVQMREELGLGPDEELGEDLRCFECGDILYVEDGFWIRHVSQNCIGATDPPKPAKGRRVRPKLREFVRVRDRRTCQICRRVLDLGECTMHHVKAWSKGGETSDDNLVVACKDCQQRLGTTELERRTVIDTEFVRQLGDNEMALIYELTHTEEQMEEDIQRVLQQWARWYVRQPKNLSQ